LTARDSDPAKFLATLAPFIYDSATPAKQIQEDLAMCGKWHCSVEAYFAQSQAVLTWEASGRIPQIKAPTLVIHGENDRLIPAANAKLIAERMPGAKLVLIPRAGHVFTTDQTEVAHVAILEFLGAQATRQQERSAPVLKP
jgi:pimeloyl-ACP methyl ester carboxylesterase